MDGPPPREDAQRSRLAVAHQRPQLERGDRHAVLEDDAAQRREVAAVAMPDEARRVVEDAAAVGEEPVEEIGLVGGAGRRPGAEVLREESRTAERRAPEDHVRAGARRDRRSGRARPSPRRRRGARSPRSKPPCASNRIWAGVSSSTGATGPVTAARSGSSNGSARASSQPRIDDAVVVGEGDQLTVRLEDAAVAGSRLPRKRLEDVADGQRCADRRASGRRVGALSTTTISRGWVASASRLSRQEAS